MKAIQEQINQMLNVKQQSLESRRMLEEANRLFQNFENASTYASAQEASNALITYMKQQIYMGEAEFSNSDKELKNQIAVLVTLLEEEIDQKHRLMTEFEREKQIEESELAWKVEMAEDKMKALVALSYELAAAVEKARREQEAMPVSVELPDAIHDKIYAEVKAEVKKTIEDVFESLGIEKPELAEYENEAEYQQALEKYNQDLQMYEKAKALYEDFENEKDYDKAMGTLEEFINCVKIFKYSHYDEYGQKDEKDPAYFEALRDKLKDAKTKELKSPLDRFRNSVEKISNKLSAFVDSLTHQEEKSEERTTSRTPEPPMD